MLRALKNTCKIISVLSLVPLATFLVKPDVALAGNFSETCDDIQAYEDEDNRYMLEATCDDKQGRDSQALIPISEFIANYGGNLSWANPTGNFHKSCLKIEVDEDGLLSADCGNGRGGWIGTELNLNERITNNNGDFDYDE